MPSDVWLLHPVTAEGATPSGYQAVLNACALQVSFIYRADMRLSRTGPAAGPGASKYRLQVLDSLPGMGVVRALVLGKSFHPDCSVMDAVPSTMYCKPSTTQSKQGTLPFAMSIVAE